MPISVRLDEETESLLLETAEILNTTKSEILKASIRDFCGRTLKAKRGNPYSLLADLIGKEFSGQGNLAIDSEKILREAFRREK
ncbi:MAG: hypothetical protein JRI71_05975 [Deltaproteobacteria bacterium]|nr:hypothetical protein [Deltaproteobacteria bacterium]